jgi:CheY-like chemotaxis protein
MRILVAEDEFIVRLVVTEALADAGHEIIAAPDGNVALKLLEDPGQIAAVVTDFHMPGADGIVVAEAARQRHPGIPVVVITGRPDVLKQWKTDPPYICLPKPFSIQQLTHTVAQALGHLS